MKKIILTTVLAFILLVFSGILVTQAMAETKTVKSKTTTYITKSEVIPVFDVKGHIIGMFERRGLTIFETGEVAAYLNRATFDLTKGQGKVQGYSQLTYKDGSTAVFKWQCNASLPPGEKLSLIKGEGKYTQGTGRFKGIKGTVSFTGRFITPISKETKGDLYVESTSTYTLPSQ